MGLRMRRRTVYVATIVAMLAMVGGWALATTTTTVMSQPGSANITTSQPTGFSTATVGSDQVVVVTSAIAAYSSAGTQSAGTVGLAGQTIALNACSAGTCTQSFLSVNGNAATAGDYAEQLVIAVTQPASTGTSTGFDIQIEVSINSNSLVFGDAYFATGVAGATSSQTVNVYLFIDLGVNGINAPTISSISVQFNGCNSNTSCP